MTHFWLIHLATMLTLAFQYPALTTPQHGRSLSYAQILSYSPGSQVTDHSSECDPMLLGLQ